eukprot:CAMPEP_0201887278 /NCGR_PEP_ID=MMETSP0902-20130614/24537_1 /ASSEMBLY_ACC=CAM_ASM_000551 /TAXON_ID=420261 /ORGANISM="Thalassiosira antarctica, Strain CCMP982" /LENGTH=65 /DNA_ID=CAMNT_0048417167 /DNA_START=211 /DNA_END=408 /DNA_ORIENTATION=+
MTDSLDHVPSYDSRWEDDGTGWHGRPGVDGKVASENEPASLGAKLQQIVEGFACGYICAGGSKAK